MCNGFGIDGPTVGVVLAGAVILSPLIIVGGVVGGVVAGTAYAGVKGAEKAGQVTKQVRTTNLLRKIRNRYIKRMKAGEWQAYLQQVHDRTTQDPMFYNLHEMGVAMLAAEDALKAEEYLTAAIAGVRFAEVCHRSSAASLFARGLANQTLRDYGQAAKDFEEAAGLIAASPAPCEVALCRCCHVVEENPMMPIVSRAECLNSLGYSLYLRSLYGVLQAKDYCKLGVELATDGYMKLPLPDAAAAEVAKFLRSQSTDLRTVMAQDLLKKAVEEYDVAIAESADKPKGMFVFNRGKAKYYLALLSSMPKSFESEATQASEADSPMVQFSNLHFPDVDTNLMAAALKDFESCVTMPDFGTTAEGHAMQAQALAVLGQPQEAAAARTLAHDLDPRTFLVDLTSHSQLLTPWPLPPSKQGEQAHDFEQQRFFGSHFCDRCLEIIPGLTTSFCCKRCDFHVHRACFDKASKLKTCWSDGRDADRDEKAADVASTASGGESPLRIRKRLSSFGRSLGLKQGGESKSLERHVHSMASVYFHKPTWCDQCSGLCVVPSGYKCIECRFCCHRDCLDKVANAVVNSS